MLEQYNLCLSSLEFTLKHDHGRIKELLPPPICRLINAAIIFHPSFPKECNGTIFHATRVPITVATTDSKRTRKLNLNNPWIHCNRTLTVATACSNEDNQSVVFNPWIYYNTFHISKIASQSVHFIFQYYSTSGTINQTSKNISYKIILHFIYARPLFRVQ